MHKDQIVLTAIFQSVRSTVDGGLRVTFDLDASQAELLSKIIALKDKALYVVVTEQ
jgi:hypothetical protein